MRHPHGYSVTADVDTGRQVESDVVTCCHCQKVCEVPPGPMTGFPWCFKCGRPTCQSLACIARCDPWERRLERMEARERFHRAMESLR